MRRFFMGMTIMSLSAACPIAVHAGDREIADAIVNTLKERQSDGSLKDFDLDLTVEEGVVTLSGSVANPAQAAAVVSASRSTEGVVELVNKITIRQAALAQTAAPAALPVATAPSEVMPAAAIEVAKPAQPEAAKAPESNENTQTSEVSEPPAMPVAASTVTPMDARTTDAVLGQLAGLRDSGALRNFDLDVSTVRGEVWVRGVVMDDTQRQMVLSSIQQVAGVQKVINDITVQAAATGSIGAHSPSPMIDPVTQMPTQAADGAVQQVASEEVLSSMPVMQQPTAGPVSPRAFAPSQLANFQGGVAYPDPSCPTPMAGPAPAAAGPSYGPGVARVDSPAMPSYAWPSYAAYPNYAAVTYPKQYSATAWPYIGPFYPYPQVPLGWRKVELEWDDGLWYLDFSHKSCNY